jgi:uncharacterized membrane protein YgaE (UPF0421/DUF939 family)
MKETVHYSYKEGVDRFIGTLLGGIVGLTFLLIENRFKFLASQAIIAGIGVLIVIYLCNILNKSDASVISSIVVLAIIIGVSEKSPYLYALDRVIDTFIGIIIALIVNKSVFPLRENENPSQSEV